MAHRNTNFYKHLKQVRTVFCMALFTSFMIFGLSVSANAQEKSFTIENVKVDVTADNAVEAREQAFEAAQMRAYEMLAKRMMTAEEFAEFDTPSLSKISALVRDFEVTNEKLSATRYNGTYKISFQPHPLGQAAATKMAEAKALREAEKAASSVGSTSASRTLIIPVIQRDGQNYIWTQGPYRGAWDNLVAQNQSIGFTLPSGDAPDRVAIRDDEALSYDFNRLRGMTNKYNVDETIMVFTNPQATLNGAPAVEVKFYQALPSGPSFMRQMKVPIYAGELPEELFARVAAQSQIVLEQELASINKLKSDNARMANATTSTESRATAPIVNNAQTAEMMSAQLSFSNMREWVALKRNIEQTRGVKSLVVKSMSARNAVVDIGYQGGINDLSQNLRQRQLLLQSPIQSVGNYGQPPLYELKALN